MQYPGPLLTNLYAELPKNIKRQRCDSLMISYTSAIAIIQGAARTLDIVELPISKIVGMVAGTDIHSRSAVPSFDNAAMDGYALRSGDTLAATADAPVELSIAGSIAAGQAAPRTTPTATAWEIMTGAPMPGDCDTVLPVERARTSQPDDAASARLLISGRLEPGLNRREAGSDFPAAALLVSAGARLGAPALMALAAGGCDTVAVRRKPRIAVMTTGSELAYSGLPDAAGRIRDANGPYLDALLAGLGIVPAGHRSVADDPDTAARELSALAADADIVLTTGGVSAGRLDFMPAMIARLGGEILFHKVAIRPGKPLLFARLPGGQLLFGLPGNPMAVAVGLRFFVLPAIGALLGRPPERYLPARCLGSTRKRAGLTFFAKAHAQLDYEAQLGVQLLPGQESFRILPLLQANCWAIVPEGREDLTAGDLIEIAPLLPGEFPAPPR